jgi:hypothetical protein
MKENAFDRLLILGNVTVAGVAKAFSWHDVLTNAVLVISFLLALLRVVDWFVRRYKYGWQPKGEDTQYTPK